MSNHDLTQFDHELNDPAVQGQKNTDLESGTRTSLAAGEGAIKRNYGRWLYLFVFLVAALAVGGWATQSALSQLFSMGGKKKEVEDTSPFTQNKTFTPPLHQDPPPLMPAASKLAPAPAPAEPVNAAGPQDWGQKPIPVQPTQVPKEMAAAMMKASIGEGSKPTGETAGQGATASLGGLVTVEDQAERIARTRGGGDITKTKQSVAGEFGNLDYLVPRGFRINCLNYEEFSSDKPGEISCNIERDIYSYNGKTLLIPKGSKAQGKSGGGVTYGDTRVAAMYDRLMTPDGRVIDFESPMGDGLGVAGFAGNVDRHWGLKLGAAFGVALAKDLMAIGITKASQSSSSTSNTTNNGATVVLPSNTISAGDQLASQVAQRTLGVQDTITIPRSQQMVILVAQDMWFLPKEERAAR